MIFCAGMLARVQYIAKIPLSLPLFLIKIHVSIITFSLEKRVFKNHVFCKGATPTAGPEADGWFLQFEARNKGATATAGPYTDG